MKAITLHEPWATLIAAGKKTIETRDWKPPAYLLGERIAIHAGRRKPTGGDLRLLKGIQERTELLPLGCVVATATLADTWQVGHLSYAPGGSAKCPAERSRCLAHSNDMSRWVEIDPYGNFAPGRWLWFLADVEPLMVPRRAVGHQRFWEWEG